MSEMWSEYIKLSKELNYILIFTFYFFIFEADSVAKRYGQTTSYHKKADEFHKYYIAQPNEAQQVFESPQIQQLKAHLSDTIARVNDFKNFSVLQKEFDKVAIKSKQRTKY